jgi:hypothetical protein
MGILNDQVRMGRSLADTGIGRIRHLGAPPPPPPQPIITTTEGIGLAGGLLTILTAIFLKGIPRALVLASGGLAAGVAGTSAIVRAVSKPAAPAPTGMKPNPNIPLAPPLSPSQLLLTAQRTLAPMPLTKSAMAPAAAAEYKPGSMVFESDLYPKEISEDEYGT